MDTLIFLVIDTYHPFPEYAARTFLTPGAGAAFAAFELAACAIAFTEGPPAEGPPVAEEVVVTSDGFEDMAPCFCTDCSRSFEEFASVFLACTSG